MRRCPEIAVPVLRAELLPPPEVYTVVRESGFSPLGVPQQRGFVYTIAVVGRDGDDGRLVIDARNGRIVRFMPAYGWATISMTAVTTTYGRSGRRRSALSRSRSAPAGLDPACASRTAAVPIPKRRPARR